MVHACSELFSQADANGDGKLSQKNFKNSLIKFDTSGDGFFDEEEFLKLLTLAGQYGEHLAKNLNQSKEDAFKYVHRGSFSYIGGSQAALDAGGYSFTGFFTYFAWSSFYWNKQNWTKTRLFGRDFSRF
eukprot:gene6460-10466_t